MSAQIGPAGVPRWGHSPFPIGWGVQTQSIPSRRASGTPGRRRRLGTGREIGHNRVAVGGRRASDPGRSAALNFAAVWQSNEECSNKRAKLRRHGPTAPTGNAATTSGARQAAAAGPDAAPAAAGPASAATAAHTHAPAAAQTAARRTAATACTGGRGRAGGGGRRMHGEAHACMHPAPPAPLSGGPHLQHALAQAAAQVRQPLDVCCEGGRFGHILVHCRQPGGQPGGQAHRGAAPGAAGSPTARPIWVAASRTHPSAPPSRPAAPPRSAGWPPRCVRGRRPPA